MLSRVADALFWMSRYVERAEHVARLLDVWFHLELDLSGAGAPPFEMHWTALASILQQQVPARDQARERHLHLLGLAQHELADMVLEPLEEFWGIEWHRFGLSV